MAMEHEIVKYNERIDGWIDRVIESDFNGVHYTTVVIKNASNWEKGITANVDRAAFPSAPVPGTVGTHLIEVSTPLNSKFKPKRVYLGVVG